MTLVEFLNAAGLEGARQDSPVVIRHDEGLYDITEVTLSPETGQLVLEVQLQDDTIDE